MTLNNRLQEILAAENLTPYKASEIIAAQTNEEFRAVEQRLVRWRSRAPKTWVDLERSLAILGYEIRIEKSSGSRTPSRQAATAPDRPRSPW